MSYFLSVQLDDTTLEYLRRIVHPPIIEFYPAPIVYLTSPRTEILSKEQAFAFDKLPVKLDVEDLKVLYNSSTGRSELDVLVQLNGDRVQLLDDVLDDEGFQPYFAWSVDPMRSMASRSFVTNVINSVMADKPSLSGIVVPQPVPGNASYTYSSSTTKTARSRDVDSFKDD